MRFDGTWTANTKYEKTIFLIPTIVVRQSFEEWTVNVLWLGGGFVVEFD